mmetsp:Transcript_17200/g.38734  ORF Transcript_17200/g.38734 Transcript_17200/m.38734 type:complete len:683 (-) Transcript_17200:844-2892(-)
MADSSNASGSTAVITGVPHPPSNCPTTTGGVSATAPSISGVKKEEDERPPQSVVDGKGSENEHNAVSPSIEDGEAANDDEGERDDEERFFVALEDEGNEQAAVADVNEVAPTLLKGQMGIDAEGHEKAVTSAGCKLGDDGTAQSNSVVPDQRARQLDFLLSKATEYSNFIAQDLEELQKDMAEEASRKLANSAKRKRGKEKGDGGKLKKSKTGGDKPAGELLQEAKDRTSESSAMAASNGQAIFVQPANLANNCVLKDYQLEGVRWLTSLYENGVSGILADDMGLGKTIQVIAMVAHLKTMKVLGPYLVVAPLATLPNWVREFEKWLPGQPVVRYHGPNDEREKLRRTRLRAKDRKNPNFPVIITSYEVAIRDKKRLNNIGEYTYLVVDEGQRLKNHRCTLIKSLREIRAANRLLLSGTPIQNNLDELWSLLNFVNPQIFDDLSVFQSWFGFRSIGKLTTESEIMAQERSNNVVSKLHEILRPFLLRRIKMEVLKDLPPKKEVVVYAGRSRLQQSYSKQIDDGTLRTNLMEQGVENAKMIKETNKQMNHRKNSNHPFLFGEPFDSNTGMHVGTVYPQLLVRASGKFALLDRMLRRLHADKHQVLIFSQMTSVLSIIEDYLNWVGYRYCRIDGSTHIDDRQKQMDAFNAMKTSGKDGGLSMDDDRLFVFLLSTRAGGVGINLV